MYFCNVKPLQNPKFMKKSMVEIEHQLNSTSKNIVWRLISTSSGLEKWIADRVEIDGKNILFAWGDDWRHHETRAAIMTHCEKYKCVRWHWNDDADECYVEIRMEQSDLSGELTLCITDFADAGDTEWLQAAWQHNFKRLYQSCGV